MRNWNRIQSCLSSGETVVTSLPMRNWNRLPVAAYVIYRIVTSLPMRNWNPIFSPAAFTSQKLPAYLWGIETDRSAAVYDMDGSLPAYLWGIETRRGCRWCQNPAPVTSLPMRNWNPPVSLSNPRGFGCYQPTYEELKLVWIVLLLAAILVTSLPMRNWNPKNGWPKNDLTVLPAYLWGIETKPSF